MASKAEIIFTRALREALFEVEPGQALPDSQALDEAMAALTRVLPDLLEEGGAIRWRFEGLDGFMLAQATKTAPRQARLVGLAVTLADFGWTPFVASIRIVEDQDAIEWARCGLGELLEDGQVRRVPEDACSKLLFRLPARVDEIEWTYEAERGRRAGLGSGPTRIG